MKLKNTEPAEFLDQKEQIHDLISILSTLHEVSFDTEFMRENTFFPQFELLQIGTEDRTWIVDVGSFLRKGEREVLQNLFQAMNRKDLLKIGHALLGDQEAIYWSFGMTLTPCVDTAVAASVLGMGDQIGLAPLLEKELGVRLKKGHSRSRWGVRPLSPELLEYAKLDVEYLVRLWKSLEEKLLSLGRMEWVKKASEKNCSVSLFDYPAHVFSKKYFYSGKIHEKDYPLLLSLFEWRERRVRELNLPRKRLAEDKVILDLVRTKPKSIEQLRQHRGLSQEEVKKKGEILLGLIHDGMRRTDVEAPERKKFIPPSKSETRTLSFFSVFLALVCDQKNISQRALFSQGQLLELLRWYDETNSKNRPVNLDDLRSSKIAEDEVMRLVGEELLSFLSGKVSMSYKNGRVIVDF